MTTSKATKPTKVELTGADLRRRWDRAGEAASRRGMGSYTFNSLSPSDRKKAERAAQVDANARSFRAAMAGVSGLGYYRKIEVGSTQQAALSSFLKRPRFSTLQRIRRYW